MACFDGLFSYQLGMYQVLLPKKVTDIIDYQDNNIKLQYWQKELARVVMVLLDLHNMSLYMI